MINFDNKTALVTGASGSIGSTTAKLLHSLGATVVLSGTNEAKLQELAKDMKNERCSIKVCDLSDHQQTQSLVEDIDNLDILVCNAGITQDALSINMPLKSFQEVIDIKLVSSFILNKAAITKMIKKRYR